MMEAASQMTVSAVLFVRTNGEHETRQRQRRRVCSKIRVYHLIQDLLQSVSIQKVVLCHVNGPKHSQRWTSHQIPTAAQAHHQLGDVESTFQTLKRSSEKLLQSMHNSVRNKLCHVSRVFTMSLTEPKETVRSSGRLQTVDLCGTRRPRTPQIQSRWSKT